MSYRDLRNFTEMLRALGYSRMVSLENFRQPNFKLVAEILVWLVGCFDPEADLPTDIETESDRVLFIKAMAQFMATKAYVKMNPKRLYQADGYAVKELLKATSVLYGAMSSHSNESVSSSQAKLSMSAFDMSSHVHDLKLTRQLSTEITTRGLELYDLLGREVELRAERLNAIARPLEVDKLERGVRASIGGVNEAIKETYQMMDNLASDEANLDTKIKNKRAELERNQKRLQSLQRTRPGFMDEYDKLEVELAKCYETYIEKHRNLSYLEHRLEEYHRAEQDRFEETEQTLKRMQDRLRQDELRVIRGEGNMDALVLEDSDLSDDGHTPDSGRPQAFNKTAKNFGSMALGDSESGSESDSLDLGSDDGGLPFSDDSGDDDF